MSHDRAVAFIECLIAFLIPFCLWWLLAMYARKRPEILRPLLRKLNVLLALLGGLIIFLFLIAIKDRQFKNLCAVAFALSTGLQFMRAWMLRRVALGAPYSVNKQGCLN
jgi:presenilin-like A22 family membrane protease